MSSISDRHFDAPLDMTDKGASGSEARVPLDQIAQQNWNLLREDLPLPAAILKDVSLRRNSAWMRGFLERTGAKIAPHGKTTMAPALFDLQIADGAWGITLSTPHQIRVARRFGYDRIFVANQLVGRKAIEYVFQELEAHPEFELYCLADSLANVDQLAAVGARLGGKRALKVLVEVGVKGGRTGCRTLESALTVARAIAASPHLALAGVEGFEGIITGPSAEQRLERVKRFLSEVRQVADACSDERLFQVDEVIITAGGSTYFDVAVESFESIELDRPKLLLIRSGCYLTHDSIMYTRAFAQLKARAPDLPAQLGELEPALEVWAYVQSRPEPGRLIAALGKRDISYDDLPVPLMWHRPSSSRSRPLRMPADHEVIGLNDQHCYLKAPEDSPLEVGDMIGFGISHPCLTFDKWRVLHRVDDDYQIIGTVRTYF